MENFRQRSFASLLSVRNISWYIRHTISIYRQYSRTNACSQFAGESETTSKPTPAQVGAAIKLPKDTTYADLLNKEDFHFLDSIVRQSLKSPLNKVYIKPNFLALILGEIEKGKKLVDTGYSQSRIDSMKSQVMDIALEKKQKRKASQLSAWRAYSTPLYQKKVI